ncbi:MAG: thiol reductant ABC exporter subunit CydD [Eggerthellaceae bacterium]|nr:thiol reductant ABC exporter subunit CydD [Eggerthellaceae bacterium]
MIDRSLFSLPGAPRVLAALLFTSLLQVACVLGQAFSLSNAIVNIWNAQPVSDQMGLLAVFFACYLGKQIVLAIQERFLSTYAYQRCAALRQQLLERIFTSRTRVVRENGTAAVTTAAMEGTDLVENYLRLILPKMMGMVVLTPVILVTTCINDWVSGIILLAMLPVIVMFMIMLGRTAKAKAEEQFDTYQRMSNHFVDTLRGIDTLAAFGASIRERSRIWHVSERFRIATVDTLRVATLSGAVLDMCSVFGIGAVAIMMGLRLADGSMALAIALPILIMAPEYFKPIRDFASDFHASLDGKNALADIVRMVASADEGSNSAIPTRESTEEPDEKSLLHAKLQNAQAETNTQRAKDSCKTVQTPHTGDEPHISPWGPDSTLELRGIRFCHEPGIPALQDVNLLARGYQKIGIVGASGAGKSTLADLLGGFSAPDAGTIVLNGLELPNLGLDGWQHQALYIPQNPYLFHATLRDNITFYTPAATDEQVEYAVEVVGLRKLVDELPQGLDTVIGEGARGLSGGQAQRIALARVLLDPSRKVLLFDEPTAHLDIETELELKERMLPLMQNHLVFFATHRLHWLANMDYILVLDDGKVVEEGTPTELMESHGALTQLAEHLNAGLCIGAEEARSQVANNDESKKRSSTHHGKSATCAAETAKHTTSAHKDAAESDEPNSSSMHDHGTVSSDRSGNVPGNHDTVEASGFFIPGFARWVRPYFGRYRKQLACALALGFAMFGCSALLMYTAGFLICWTSDPALPTLAAIMYAVGFVQIFGVCRPISRYLERLFMHDWVFRMTSSLRVRLYRIVEAQAMHVKRRSRIGDFLGLLVEDIGHLQNLFLRTLFPTAIAGLLFGASVLFFGVFDIRFALFMLVVLGMPTVAAPLVSMRVNRMRIDECKRYRNELYTELIDNVMGAADWVFAGRGREYLSRHELAQERAHAAQAGTERYARVNDVAEAACFGIGAVLVVLWAAAHFSSGHVGGTSNWIAAFALGYLPLIEAFAPVAASVTQMGTYTDTLRRLDALPQEGDVDPDLHAPDEPCESDEQATPPLPMSISIDLEDVSFAYDNERKLVLDHVTLHVPAGQKVAILGRSGAGKSTLLHVARGDLMPHQGTVCIGKCPACDIGNEMHRYIGLVQQQTYLFNRTLRENLTLSNPDAADNQIWDALRKVRMDHIADRMPQGLDTVLDEAGTQFSGGERHRLSFARILLANTPIIVLDEPMVGLDPATEHDLMETLFDMCAERTVVMVTHHLQDIAHFDRVVFVEGGHVERDGSPVQLAASDPEFRSLLQFDRGFASC